MNRFINASSRHRINYVINPELEGCRGIMHGHPAFVDPFKKFADVVIVVQNHLKVFMRVAKP